MSRIDDLIAEHCPDGVGFRPLGLLGRRNSGTAITAGMMKTLSVEGGPVRIFAGGRTVADVEEDAVPDRDIVRVPSIIVKSRGHIGFTFYSMPFTHKSELWSYSLTDPAVDQKFIYYYLITRVPLLQERARATSVKLPQLSVRDTDELRVPVPPLEVQREIVRILDQFTALEAELEARRSQYAHFRNELLTSGHAAPMVPLGDLGRWYGGGTPSKLANRYWTDGTIPWLSPKDMLGDNVNTTQKMITEAAVQETPIRLVPVDSIAIVVRSNILRRLLPVARVSFATTLNQDMRALVPKPGVLPSYAFFAIRARANEILSAAGRTDGSMAAIDSARLLAFKVPLPSIEDQGRIVKLLDKFDALVNDLSIGLPAELAARRKQYEHYRDRLLTFAELPG